MKLLYFVGEFSPAVVGRRPLLDLLITRSPPAGKRLMKRQRSPFWAPAKIIAVHGSRLFA